MRELKGTKTVYASVPPLVIFDNPTAADRCDDHRRARLGLSRGRSVQVASHSVEVGYTDGIFAPYRRRSWEAPHRGDQRGASGNRLSGSGKRRRRRFNTVGAETVPDRRVRLAVPAGSVNAPPLPPRAPSFAAARSCPESGARSRLRRRISGQTASTANAAMTNKIQTAAHNRELPM